MVNPDNDTSTHQNNPTVELNPDEIIVNPGLRKPIRDAARREYFVMGPCQPVGHKFPRKLIAK